MKRRRRNPEPPGLQETEYGAMFERLSGDVGLKVETLFREVDEAAGLLAEILGAPEAERRALLDQGVRFRSLRLCPERRPGPTWEMRCGSPQIFQRPSGRSIWRKPTSSAAAARPIPKP